MGICLLSCNPIPPSQGFWVRWFVSVFLRTPTTLNHHRILGLLRETARSMLPFSFESENWTVRGISSMGGRELLDPHQEGIWRILPQRPRFTAAQGIGMDPAKAIEPCQPA